MNESLLFKLNGLKNKGGIIKIFVSPKALSWCNYFVDIIIQCFSKYEFIRNTNDLSNADIIITHIKQRTEYHSDKAINIIFSGESYSAKYKYDISISTVTNFNSYYNIYLPYLYMSLKEHTKSIDSKDYVNTKNNFCAYMYSAIHTHRIHYFNLLNNYNRVDAMGKCCKNMELNIDRAKYNQNMTFLDEAVQIYSGYKFVLALEHKMVDGYVTEKIINPLIANCIPIYWGADRVFEFINKERFIYALDYDDSGLIKKIKEIHENADLFNEMTNKPIYCENKDPETIFGNFKEEISKLFQR
jgi:hypothetical protein